jgi:dihydrophenazinedicarboxylate synthase
MSDLSPPHGTPAAPATAGAPRSETLTGSIEVSFPEFLAPPAEPMGLLASWLETSVAHGVREPRALALATADARGRTSSRMVAVNSVTDAGIVFITHAMSTVARQSRPFDGLDHVAELRTRARELSDLERPLPRPASFVGYELAPDTVEFWANGTDRLHERLRYDRTGDGWETSRLQP